MALGFFRRHQKMVIVIMVILMVAFLLGGSQLLSCSRDRAEEGLVLGTTTTPAEGEISSGDVAEAGRQLQLLSSGTIQRQLIVPIQAFFEVEANPSTGQPELGGMREQAPLTWALLVAEARAAGLEATDYEVEQMLLSIQASLGQKELNPTLVAIANNANMQPMPSEEDIRQTLADYLIVEKNYLRNVPLLPVEETDPVGAPVSDFQARKFFRDRSERIKLAFVSVPASKYLPDVPAPTDDQIREMFEAHKDQPPEVYTGPDDFGFGYRQPPKVAAQGLIIDRQTLQQAVRPSSDDIENYIAANPGQFRKTVEPEEGAEEDGEPRLVEMTTAEKTQLASERLQRDQVAQTVANLQDTITRQLLTEFEGPGEKAYPYVMKQLKSPASGIMDKTLSVKIVRKPLAEALEMLSEAAGVQVVFPVGKHGEVNIDENVLVDLPAADGGTLAAALGQLSEKFEIGPFQYFQCRQVPNSIFPVSETIDLFPIVLASTGLVDAEAFKNHDVFGQAFLVRANPNPQKRNQPEQIPLVRVAFSVRELTGRQGREDQSLQVGVEGPVAWHGGDPMGPMIWRVVEARTAQTPEQLTDQLKQRVADDWKLKQAFQMAQSQLKESVNNPAAMRSLADSMGLAVHESEMLTRRMVPLLDEHLLLPNEAEAQLELFYNKAFSLAPDNVNTNFPRMGKQVAVIPLPAIASVVLAQRIDYEPAVEEQMNLAAIKTGLRFQLSRDAI
ncbi:MAG: hypothetical protein ACOCZE_09050, partial [Planctomycetota bacterium]